MRFDRLDLTRFGPFTDRSLDLSAPGIHLVLGHNEAGKTTAMAAIRQLLYGIPVRTPHAFLHEMRDLRLGATLADGDGSTLELVRVKKQSNTLRSPDGETITEATLARVLHDVTEEVFASLFTIGHEEIVAGGEALLDSDGEVGRALFSASRGTTDLTAVLRRLDDRAAHLFKSSASKPLLNAALKQYTAATDEAKRLSLSASDVVGLDEELASARAAHDAIAETRRTIARRRTLLHQTRAARPLLVTRAVHLAERSRLEAGGPLVDVGLRQRLESARSRKQEGESTRRTATAHIERLDAKLADLTIDTALIDQQDEIERLTRQTGGYDQNEQDLPGLEAKAATLGRELEQLRKKLPERCPLDEFGRSILTVDQTERISRLADARSAVASNHERAAEAARDASSELDKCRAELAELGQPADVTALDEAILRIRKVGDPETDRTDALRDLGHLEADLRSRLSALGLVGADPQTVDTIAVPPVEFIRSARTADDRRNAAIASLERTIDDDEVRLTAISTELAQLLRREAPPTIDALARVRARRDEGWQLIRDVWRGDGPSEDVLDAWRADLALPDAYEAAVAQSDDMADRLRREAGAVEQRASLEAQIAELDSKRDRDRAEHRSLTDERDTAANEWAARWQVCGVTAGDPAQMETWYDDFRTCVHDSERVRRLANEVAALDTAIERHRNDLAATLRATGNSADDELSLQGLLDHAEQTAIETADAARRFRAACDAVEDAEENVGRQRRLLEDAARALDRWSAEWAAAIATIGLTAAATASEATAVLRALESIDTKAGEHDDLERRIVGIKERSKEFTDGVAALRHALELDAELADVDPAAAVKMLGRRLAAAKEVAAKHHATIDERTTQQEAVVAAEQKVTEAEESIDELARSVHLTDETELAAAITRSEEVAALVDQVRELEGQLQTQAGKPLAQIEADAADLDGVEIDPEIQQLDIELESIDDSLKETQTSIGELRNKRAQIDSSGAAADQMTRAQQSLAEVVDHAEEYVRVVLAKLLLEEQVDRYRDENQGPLLQRARELFCALTLGRYDGLDTDTDDKGVPLLLARTADDRLLEINMLSTGTRDQLYLSLRLAALEQFMARRGPLPLVLDDLFVHFDDERTVAGLEVLDRLADTTQVLLFTHHSQVARLAGDVIAEDRLTIHEL